MRGLSVVEFACVTVILFVAAAAFLVLMPRNHYESPRTECMSNVRNLVGVLGVVPDAKNYPELSGANLLLWIVTKGHLEGEDSLRILFCPEDSKESLEKAGGAKAYEHLDLSKRGYDHLTSYAARDLTRAGCGARPQSDGGVVLVCDDSDDHHKDGFVVGLTNGAAKFRYRLDDWGLVEDARVTVGPDSMVAELRCLRRD